MHNSINRTICLTAYICFFTSCCCYLVADDSKTEQLSKEVYGILNRSCFECHGPLRQDGGLRLDSHEAILQGGDSGSPIDLQDPKSSEILNRIQLPKGHDQVMPKRGDVLAKQEINLIRDWISTGAQWSADAGKQIHWSYLAPIQPEVPVSGHDSSVHPIDAFVRLRLDREGMKPSAVADFRVLARRLYLDIIGLPPSPADVDAFAAEAAIDLQSTVERWVDRLLNSAQYGEKWARPWLDAARYADSHGFQRDDLHELWAYRDWVIQALNSDMPFDQFTIEQLAGDLLPNPTESQLVATGFNRCSPCNVEAGTDPEENRFNQVVDRVNTLGYVWLGATLECAQCHNHKYDPFSQKDYYGLFAFFNQSELEADRANPKVPGSIRFNGPYMELKSLQNDNKNEQLGQKIAKAQARLKAATNKSDTLNDQQKESSSLLVLKPTEFESLAGSNYEILDDGAILLSDDNTPDTDTYTMTVDVGGLPVVGILLETLTDPSLPGTGPGRGDSNRPNFVLTSFEIRTIDSSGVVSSQSMELTDAKADFSQTNFDAPKAANGKDDRSGWAIAPKFKQPHWIAFRLKDHASLAGATRLQIKLIQNYGAARTIGRFRLSAITGDYAKAFPTASVESLEITKLRKALETLEVQREKKETPKTLVMREVESPRMSTLFARGDFKSPGDVVEPSTPKVLHPYTVDGPRNRLALAKWLVSKENPLVSRVIVNRMWLEVFGSGLVKTPEDFGLKGERATHPELLDWLASEFMKRGWSQKELLKTLLTCETYRQSSRISVESQEKDPENTLLSRGPRFRLPAESIRDNALAISGLLSLKQFGPPIRPPQPEGLWKKVGGQQYDYQVSAGEDQYRRGVYVVWKRMSPYPSFTSFDATPRLACRVSRGRSNTPLQALTLLNDPVYVESARRLAARVLEEVKVSELDKQLEYAFRLAVSRLPSEAEQHVLRRLFEQEMAASDSVAAQSNAWFAVATAILNLDETITKE